MERGVRAWRSEGIEVYSYHTVPYRGLERPSQSFELYIVALSTYLE